MRGQGVPDQVVASLRDLGSRGDSSWNIMEEMRERFRSCADWESTCRRKMMEDLKFADADAFNGYQWPDSVRRTRDLSDKPCLTLNVTRQHNLKIINDMRRAKESCKILGMGNGATQESANIVKQLIRHIEYNSKAQRNAYTKAREYQVKIGIGWWRIVTDYESNESFDQEIYIQGIPDPFSVYMDPDCTKPDCSDARFAFVFSFMPRDLTEALIPDYPWQVGAPKTPIGIAPGESFFLEKDHWLVAEYFRKVPVKDTLISFITPMGDRLTVRESRLPARIASELKAQERVMVRNIVDQQVEWKLVVGDEIVDETIWPGKYIPLIRCIGEEGVIEGILDRKGHTRALTDAQRMFNYNASASVEFGALQTKTPWLAAAKSIEGLEGLWNTANTENHSVLVWNHVDDDNPEAVVPPPQKIDPPNASPAFEQGMQTAFMQMMMTSGQWANQQGQMGNERTGTAIQERLREGESATYHFTDNYEDALVYTYQQIIDLIPKVYDTRRIKHILADDGIEMEIELDPAAAQPYMQQMDRENRIIRRVLNPTMGTYEVAASIGPNVETKRQEAVEDLTQILTEAPALTAIIGDILLRNMDFDDAQEAAMRLRRMVPPQAMGQGPTQNEQQMAQQIQTLQANLAKALEQHGKDAIKLSGKDQMREIDVYEAETDRIKALAPMLPMDQEGLRQIIEQLISDTLETNLMPIMEANIHGQGTGPVAEQSGMGGSEAPPIPGAQKAPDGEWYILDPTRRTRYLRVGPLAQERAPPGGAGTGS